MLTESIPVVWFLFTQLSAPVGFGMQLNRMDWGLCVGLSVEVMAVPAMEFGPLYLVELEAGAGSCGTVVLTSHCCVGK